MSVRHSMAFFSRLAVVALTILVLTSAGASAAGADAPHLDGRQFGLIWILPFAGILLSIAIMPLAAPSFWHHHFGKVAAGWALAFLLPFLYFFGFKLTLHELLHTLLLEYIPFLILILALFTVAGGIYVSGNIHGTPAMNTAILGIGTVIASWVGTTGASMLLIRPIIRANDDRVHNAHVIVFFIFLVSNIGGALTPLGDPPLFLGFLQGVDFFWTTKHLFMPTLLLAVVLLTLFFALDSYLYAKEGRTKRDPTPDSPITLQGKVNFILLGVLVAVVLASGLVKTLGTVHIYTVEVDIKSILRDVALVGVALLSLKLTPKAVREANAFTWGPGLEVAKLFAGIFITIIPAIAMLRAGSEGAMSGIVNMVSSADGSPNNFAYFWLTGILSSFLDNAPTYLVFFNAAGGKADVLMTTLATTLAAISAGAVFMGANTYIGNAPNFMVKSIAEENGVKMPSFFGYMLWSFGILVPLFLVISLLFYR
ncbi:MAG: sodium:proton antiporter [Hyphomicrobiaceae bacterium]